MDVLQFRRRKKRLRLTRLGLAVLLGFLLIAVGVLVFVMYRGGAEGTIQTGTVKNSVTYNAVIVRSEKIVSTDEFDSADYFCAEGSEVRAGDPVMNVYKMGYSREMTLSLWRTEQEIYETQLAVLGEARDVELRTYDDGVEAAKRRLSEAVMNGNAAEILPIQNELTTLLTQRSEYLRGYIQETEQLKALYKSEADWLRAVEDSRTTLYAETSGRVSYYLDDYSVALSADKLSSVTSGLVDKALSGKGSSKWSGSNRTAAYRIVDPTEWYCVFLTDASKPLRLAAGGSYTIEIEGYGSYNGTALEGQTFEKYCVNKIRIYGDIGELINVRSARIRVEYDATDLKVESRAIQFENGSPYIELITGDGRVGVYVNVLADDGKYAIINAKNTDNAPIGPGVKYWIPKRR